jgi:hypothetical protein
MWDPYILLDVFLQAIDQNMHSLQILSMEIYRHHTGTGNGSLRDEKYVLRK